MRATFPNAMREAKARRPLRRPRRRAAGVVLIAVLFVLIVVSIAALSLAREVRIELEASARSADAVKARALVDSAIERVIAQLGLDETPEDTLFDAWREDDAAFKAAALGADRYYVFFGEPDPGDGKEFRFGVRDEASKLNLNTATREQLLALPGMDEAVVDSILDWRDIDDDAREEGAEREFYQSLKPGYRPKDGPIECLEELLLVKDVDERVLYGEDRNRNGLLDPGEDDGSRSFPPDDADGRLDRGLADYVTLVSSEPNVTLEGKPRLNVTGAQPAEVRARLESAGLAPGAAQAVEDYLKRERRVASVGQFLQIGGLGEAEFRILADQLTTSDAETIPGRINVNTAPREILSLLPGLEAEDVEAILSRRRAPDEDFSTPAWLLRVIAREKLAAIFDAVTTRSFQFSFQAAALLEDRGVMNRVEVVVDRTMHPPRVLWRRDLSALGFPIYGQREGEP